MIRKVGETVPKDPDSTEPYGIDWTAYLAELGGAVLVGTSEWEVSPAGELTLTNQTIVSGSKKTQVTLSGGVVGKTYTVRNRIETNSIPVVIDDRSFYVQVKQR